MHSIRSLTFALSLLGATLAAVTTALAVEAADHGPAAQPTGQLLPVTSKDAAWVAEQKAKYPTNLCIVSDEKLEETDMGKPVDFVYRVAGQPDRLVTFCCKHCVKDFKKDPAKYLKKLDEAAAKHGAPSANADKDHASCGCT